MFSALQNFSKILKWNRKFCYTESFKSQLCSFQGTFRISNHKANLSQKGQNLPLKILIQNLPFHTMTAVLNTTRATSETSGFSLQACKACSQQKKRCDRVLPVCGSCIKYVPLTMYIHLSPHVLHIFLYACFRLATGRHFMLIQPSRKVRKCYYPVTESHSDEALVKSLYQRIDQLESTVFQNSALPRCPDHKYPIPRQWYFSALLSHSQSFHWP